jgi:CheY-like chemotaxis protein
MLNALSSASPSTATESLLAVIVDDKTRYCELLGGWMAGLGYRVANFGSAWQALDFVRTTPSAVLETDMEMSGGLDGLCFA